jgi:membrane-associated two-gene conflict system component 1 (EACC1)
VPAAEESGPGDRIELEVSDPAQLSPLRDWMRAQPDVVVGLAARGPGPHELGVGDVVTVLASSGGVVAAIKTLPEFIRSRRRSIRIEATIRGRRFTLETTNVDDVIPIMERLLDD